MEVMPRTEEYKQKQQKALEQLFSGEKRANQKKRESRKFLIYFNQTTGNSQIDKEMNFKWKQKNST